MTIYGRSEELVSSCVECDLAEPESLTSLGGSAPGVVDGILSMSSSFIILMTTGLQLVDDGKDCIIWEWWKMTVPTFSLRMHPKLLSHLHQ